MTQTRSILATTGVVITALILATIAPALRVSALTNSSLALSDPRTSQTSTYTFDSSGFTTATTINCIQLDIGTASDGTGDAGLDLSGLTLDSHTVVSGGWAVGSVDGTTDQMRATLVAGENPIANGNIVWGGVVNGATEGTTYFGLLETFSNIDCTTGGAVDSVAVAFVYKDGELVQLTIDPTLIFTCSPVASGQTVNGATTTVGSTGTGIDHANNVTFAANGISAHDINVSTNATGGYTVSIRQTAQLSNGPDTIADWTGTNAAPTTFPAAGTEAWGYTTEDSSLAGGTANRFTSAGNVWAGFSTTNEPVIDNTVATTGTETTRVGHQVGVSTTTPAGTYQTTIIYTVASVY